jgi:hypothetical protein
MSDHNAVLYSAVSEHVVIVYSQEQAHTYLEHHGYYCRRPIEELPPTSDQNVVEIKGTAAGMIAEALRHTHDYHDRSYATHTPALIAFRPSRQGEQPENRNLLAIAITSNNGVVEESVAVMFSLEQAEAYVNDRPWIQNCAHLGPICRERINNSTLNIRSDRPAVFITGYAAHEIVTASMIIKRLLQMR